MTLIQKRAFSLSVVVPRGTTTLKLRWIGPFHLSGSALERIHFISALNAL